MSTEHLPIVVIGAGPVGLAAAAHLVKRGETPVVLEAGPEVGHNVRAWGHVRLFSPWRYVVDSAAASLLEPTGWQAPDAEALPTGKQLVERYLVPLAATVQLAPTLRLSTRVLSVTRQRRDKLKDTGRDTAPFVVTVLREGGREERIEARAVIDASGTYQTANPLGASGVPALGEAALATRIFYGIPDVLGAHRARYASRRVLVVGSGHSAFNALLDLAQLAREAPGTQVVWAFRRPEDDRRLFGGGGKDALSARGDLGTRTRALVESGKVRLAPDFHLEALEETAEGLVASDGERRLPAVDEVVATTGFRPDLSLSRELRLSLDVSVEAPSALAPLIDPNLHSCGSVPPHGEAELRHPEYGFYVVGMKAYARAPTFLLLTGYEQVRSVAAYLTGDVAAARQVHLVLPETGVCSTDFREEASACCAVEDSPRAASEGCAAGSCTSPSVAVAAREQAGGCCSSATSLAAPSNGQGDTPAAAALPFLASTGASSCCQ
ncbi:FAD-dependent oxidoreductase [Pyxidicoccus sp. MSG2]|uniref:FAD-dependent oxidoreductase n=1 Tax=Pyxidicoccus sp. MSG2 TaxID=2996790 RepID=UPI00226E8016|nr:FAD-dependent oxidoreductase [Pyxidicoccus sp. MSG2]MCY1023990.1 NAD(P)-binding domain-containing protein [Pyxidicoccus sp. MSG2]